MFPGFQNGGKRAFYFFLGIQPNYYNQFSQVNWQSELYVRIFHIWICELSFEWNYMPALCQRGVNEHSKMSSVSRRRRIWNHTHSGVQRIDRCQNTRSTKACLILPQTIFYYLNCRGTFENPFFPGFVSVLDI